MGKNKKKKEKPNERPYRAFEIFRETALKNTFYSMQRIDLIVVSLSTGSILVLISLLKEQTLLMPNGLKVLLFTSITSFALSIITNIFSQLTSHKLHSIDAEWALQEMEIMNELRDENEICEPKMWNKLTKYGNTLSITLLVIGFILSLIILGIVIF